MQSTMSREIAVFSVFIMIPHNHSGIRGREARLWYPERAHRTGGVPEYTSFHLKHITVRQENQLNFDTFEDFV